MTGRTLVLGADIGGTNTKIALAQAQAEGRIAVPILQRVYRSQSFASLERAIEAFLADPEIARTGGAIAAACFAVAGPVTEDGRARLTNLAWEPDERHIAQRFQIPRVRIVNDFAAAALGIAVLGGDDLLTLQPGIPVEYGTRVVVGAGTGLGVALLDWDASGYEVHASEAGHMDFAPVDEVQDRLLSYLRGLYSHVSSERVVSGGALKRILDFLREGGAGTPSVELAAAMETGDAAQAITALALAQRDALAMQALDIFVSAYGAFAGNMALATLARGGVYVAGGIAPKIAAKLQDGTFVRAFTAKGRFRSLLETIPVHVVRNDRAGLLGALVQAARAAR